ncbi:DNA repair protein RecN [Thermithiobacillus tepidarius DSM 3134]|uniref:DNA repair protein RecN n=1 Tax=Thermithiobacillus tepidarius TaxID=929 RepID=UPI00042290C1|nr:DNA repair protein RecN [Thermithiobacillus tepidarius]
MLSHISIRDFAIIDSLDLDLDSGLTVLTGETGAGKSIVVDALSVVLGERADPGMIRHGAEQADIAADFQLADAHPALALLEELAVADEGNCLLRRIVSRGGRSRAFINGRPVPLQQLKQVGDLVADIYGQHAHQSLLQADVQRELLDAYAGNQPLLATLRQQFRDWQAKREALQQLRHSQQERDARLELIRFQLEELEQADPKPGELEALEQERLRLAAAHQLESTASRGLEQLYEGEGAVSDTLGALSRQLTELSGVDVRLEGIASLVDGALIQVDEAAAALRNYLGHLESDPGRLDAVNDRLDQLQRLLRKHHCDYPALLARRAALAEERDQLEHLGENLQAAAAALAASAATYRETARQLSAAREAAARTLSEAVTAQMQQLGMPQGRFQVQVESRDAADETAFRQHGLDQIAFLVNTNPGQPARELAKVASGGELSRISLGIQVVLAGQGVVGTLVFDEVDVGVGGAVAEIVGRQLRQLGTRKQIFCVTHLPQVAAQGHHHLRVTKRSAGDQTLSTLVPLAPDARKEELARMLGGVQITEQTRAVAEEMLMLAESGEER